MTVLSGNRGDILVTSPGLYALASQGITPGGPRNATSLSSDGERGEGEQGVGEGLIGFVVAPLGDFVVSQRGAAGRSVTVNGRRPLGGLELLGENVVIALRPVDDLGANRSGPVRFRYSCRKGPPLRFVMPVMSSLRCAYSGRPLAGVSAIRCSGCFRLYHEEAAWQADLDEMCPTCGWTSRKGRYG